MAEKMPIEKKRVITPEFRVSFPQVFTAKSYEGQEPKYSVVMLFDQKTDLKSLKAVAMNAALEKWGTKEKFPKKLRLPFRDGSERSDTPGYEGTIFISASSKHQPGLVNQKREAILDERDFYAGCYARAELIAFAYDKKGNAGVSFSLQNVQKLRDGERFGGRKNAEDVFDSVEDGSDNEKSYESDGDSQAMGF